MISKLDKKSLNFKLWLYFISFAAAIMALLWLLQIVFLNSYYESMKIKEISRIGNELAAKYGSLDFENALVETSFNEGISINILDQTGKLVYPLDLFDILRQPRLNSETFSDFLARLYGSETDYVVYTRTDDRVRNPILVYGAILRNGDSPNYFLFINSMLEPIDSTVNVLKSQLIRITGISFLLSLGISLILAKWISRPITNITRSARALSKGDYTVSFEKGAYTEIDNLADTLNSMTRELSKTEELRKDLMANVTHDLKTPLTVIRSYSEMIRDISGESKEKREAHLATIIQESEKLSSLVDDMLELSRVQSGLRDMEMEALDLTELSREVLDRFKYFQENEGYTFQLTSNGDTIVFGDKRKLSQAVYNLIGNAVNYTDDDRRIGIKVEGEEDSVRFSIEDHGPGIAADEIDHIWDRYYRGGKSHSRRKTGSGIGLSLVKSIIMAHNGEYGVMSEEGEGSTFYFRLRK
ncbi:HAMP domain-containing sensor histidine kinase [Gudongella oleilytica]|jgi:signal transduction histidine kinase|uniref:sensor histidine kinase n=1 Tax=Gudongella oleilytica TaxID=1582259 RepID=UPI002A364DDF|nr:HAMP domain-containing sensor histidine kinase [Gudongella oleilytica]MDY0257110.1 HAMP domain-containing sensor histidine kinase [Gudongella oleilytica]